MYQCPPQRRPFIGRYLCFLLYILFCTFLGFLLGCLMPDTTTATAVTGAVASIGALLSGVVLPRSQIPWWWRWLSYAMPLSYAVQATSSTQFYCAGAEADPRHPGACPRFEMVDQEGTPVQVVVWPYLRDNFELVYDDRWVCVGVLVALILVTRVCSGLALVYVNHSKR